MNPSTKNLPKITVEQVKAELCKRSFYYFLKEFWFEVIQEKPIWNWHIEYLCDQLQEIAIKVKNREPFEYEYYIINIPPASSKSTIISQMYTCWVWVIDPTQRFICASHSQTIARKDAIFTNQILNSDKYKKYFPDFKLEREATDFIKNNKNGERYATSVGSGITGIHAHQIIVDDPLNPQQSSSNVERKTANLWLQQTLSTRKVNKSITPTILVMQRLHEEDCTGFILSHSKSVFHICLPAEESKDVQPKELAQNYINGLLDEIRLNRKILEASKSSLGSYGYSGQMMQRPSPSEGGILKKTWFKIVDQNFIPQVKTDFCCDTAYTENEKNDPSGYLAYRIVNNNLYIIGFHKGHYEFTRQIEQLPKFVKENSYSVASIIYVEPKSSGKDLVSILKKQTNLNIKEDENPTKDKEARLNDIAPFIEAGRVYLKRDAWNEEFIEQCCNFPNAKHDEEVDCLVMAGRKAFLKRGLIFI